MAEREPRETETLIFSGPEAAREFSERAAVEMGKANRGEVRQEREALAQAVAQEFEKEGEAVSRLFQPWEHTQEEHNEAQELVNLSFSKSLRVALAKARESDSYPRNLDLLHDVLTGELYGMMVKQKLNKQKFSEPPIVAGAVAIALLFLLVLIIFVLMSL